MVVVLAGTAPLHMMERRSHVRFVFVAQVVNALATVQRAADLLVGLDKALELNSQIAVLANQHVAVVLQGVNLCLHIRILALQVLV